MISRPSLYAFLTRAVLKGLTLWGFMFVYVYFVSYLFRDWFHGFDCQREKLYIHENSFDIYVCLGQSLVILSWPCQADRLLKSTYYHTSFSSHDYDNEKGIFLFSIPVDWTFLLNSLFYPVLKKLENEWKKK